MEVAGREARFPFATTDVEMLSHKSEQYWRHRGIWEIQRASERASERERSKDRKRVARKQVGSIVLLCSWLYFKPSTHT